MNGHVVVVGDVIDDILVTPLSPTLRDTDNHARIHYAAGGSAANQAAWLGFLGVPVRFFGRVGVADVERHRHELERFGVIATLAGDESASTGAIVVLHDADGGRTMYTDRGANLRLSASDIPTAVLDGAALLHVNGYPLFTDGPREVMLAQIGEARALGVPFSVDPCSAAFLSHVGADAFLEWTRGAAICFPNSAEAAVLTGCHDPFDAATALAEHYPVVALKLGADGVLICGQGAGPTLVPTSARVTGDTTGAGDAFCAGFLRAWLTAAAPEDAARQGLAVAADAVAIVGARPAVGGRAG